jgi:hypothetical protein
MNGVHAPGTVCYYAGLLEFPFNGRVVEVVAIELADDGLWHVVDADWLAEIFGERDVLVRAENLRPIAGPTKALTSDAPAVSRQWRASRGHARPMERGQGLRLHRTRRQRGVDFPARPRLRRLAARPPALWPSSFFRGGRIAEGPARSRRCAGAGLTTEPNSRKAEVVRALCAARGIAVLPRGVGFKLIGHGVDLSVAYLGAVVLPQDLEPAPPRRFP